MGLFWFHFSRGLLLKRRRGHFLRDIITVYMRVFGCDLKSILALLLENFWTEEGNSSTRLSSQRLRTRESQNVLFPHSHGRIIRKLINLGSPFLLFVKIPLYVLRFLCNPKLTPLVNSQFQSSVWLHGRLLVSLSTLDSYCESLMILGLANLINAIEAEV